MVRVLARWHVEHQGLARVVAYEQGALPEKHLATLRPLKRRFFQLFEDELAAGVAAGELQVTDPAATARAVLSLCTDIARWYRPERAPDVGALADAYGEMALRLVGARR
jgi:hypothetical protein